MVKGISRQVLVVRAPDPELFEQAIFILKEGARPVTDEELMKQARLAIQKPRRRLSGYGAVWAAGGAAVMGLLWLISAFL